MILPSRNELTYNVELNCFETEAKVKNTSEERKYGFLQGKYEFINDNLAIEFSEENRVQLLSFLKTSLRQRSDLLSK